MLYVLFLLMIRSYAHKREIFVKNASFSSWLYHLLICPFSILFAMLVLKLWLSCLFMSQF
jgi:hypothetical protein